MKPVPEAHNHCRSYLCGCIIRCGFVAKVINATPVIAIR